jgi:hypothetical protein
MILKGNIRAHGAELATHLMNARDNDAVELADMRGFVADELRGAFAEAEAIASATNCTKYLYSLSINPTEALTREQYETAIDKVEAALGLDGQPRAVVFHVKHGREHCHVAWSRIDDETMKARHMAFDRQKLREVARELAVEFGHDLPKGLAEDRGTERFAHRFNDVSMAEKGMAERTGLSPDERRAVITDAYRQSDNAASFAHALDAQGFVLAQGDKRAFVVVDRAGEVHALSRQIEGARAKDIRDTLKLDQANLPSVQEAREHIAHAMRLQASQERPEVDDPAMQLADAEAQLKAVQEAHRAELKALKSAHKDHLKAIKDQEVRELAYVQRAVKDAYRSEWAQLYHTQKAEIAAIRAETATAPRRLKALLTGRAGDAFDFENRGTLAGAFNFVIKGQVDLAKIEKAHKQERRDLGDRQKAALSEERRAIRDQARIDRADARDDHTTTLATIRRSHAEERTQAEQALKTARELNERTGLHARDADLRPQAQQSSERLQWGFGKQGFSQRGLGGREDRERDDDRDLTIKPPGMGFTP